MIQLPKIQGLHKKGILPMNRKTNIQYQYIFLETESEMPEVNGRDVSQLFNKFLADLRQGGWIATNKT